MTLSAATRRARSANPRQRCEIEAAIGQVKTFVESFRRYTGRWPEVGEIAYGLVGLSGWKGFTRNRARLTRWLTNGTLAGSELRVRTSGGVVRIEIAEQKEMRCQP
jgi:hypothetical protein